jgi:NADPH:quinone reductase-like Zn-dependent oxidoreductase
MSDVEAKTWRRVVVERFGRPEVLELREVPAELPQAGEVVVRLTSIGMNHAELMGRRGDYKLSTGDPPFTPGLEGGGVIESVGDGVDSERVGQRVTLAPDATRLSEGRGGTYASHYRCPAEDALPAPPAQALPDEQLGAVWLPYLTAWGALIWKAGLKPGQVVACPAASSSTALAAAQVAKAHGGRTIGLTTSPGKLDELTPHYDHIVVTHDAPSREGGERTMRKWHRDLKQLTDGHGVDLFFDPVAAGEYLSTEIRCLAQHGQVIVYGLLGTPGPVDVTPLIRKHASIVGYVNDELFALGPDTWMPGVKHLFDGFTQGRYRQVPAGTYPLDEVREAHAAMQRGDHVGKLILIPGP